MHDIYHSSGAKNVMIMVTDEKIREAVKEAYGKKPTNKAYVIILLMVVVILVVYLLLTQSPAPGEEEVGGLPAITSQSAAAESENTLLSGLQTASDTTDGLNRDLIITSQP